MLMRGNAKESVASKRIVWWMYRTKGRYSGVSKVAFECSGRSSRGVAQKVEVRWSRTHGKCTGKYDGEGCDCDARKVAGWIGK